MTIKCLDIPSTVPQGITSETVNQALEVLGIPTKEAWLKLTIDTEAIQIDYVMPWDRAPEGDPEALGTVSYRIPIHT